MAEVTAGPQPKHQQLRAILLTHLHTSLEPGEAIASERVLSTQYGVSRATVREALGALVREGHLVRVPGRGTFVADGPIESRLALASFTEAMHRRGLTPSSRLLAVRERPADLPLADALDLAAGDPVIELDRLRLADDRPMALERACYPAARLPGLTQHDLSGSVYALLREHYDLEPLEAEQVVGSESADAATAARLEVEPGAPLLVFRRVSTARDRRPIEHAVSRFRGDRHRIRMSLRPLGTA